MDHVKLRTLHYLFTGHDPSPLQERFYGSFPRYRGFSNLERDPEQLQAVAVLGIAQTWVEQVETESHQTIFMVPSSAETMWCLDMLRTMAQSVFNKIKAGQASRESKMKGARMIGDFLNHLHIGIPTDLSSAPEHWVAYGYQSTNTNLPEWLRESLMTL